MVFRNYEFSYDYRSKSTNIQFVHQRVRMNTDKGFSYDQKQESIWHNQDKKLSQS